MFRVFCGFFLDFITTLAFPGYVILGKRWQVLRAHTHEIACAYNPRHDSLANATPRCETFHGHPQSSFTCSLLCQQTEVRPARSSQVTCSVSTATKPPNLITQYINPSAPPAHSLPPTSRTPLTAPHHHHHTLALSHSPRYQKQQNLTQTTPQNAAKELFHRRSHRPRPRSHRRSIQTQQERV
jgi:hypothetical protein